MEKFKIGELADVKGGKRLPKGINLITTRNAHPYIRVRDLGNSKILQLNRNYEYVDDETQKSISRYIVQKEDVVLSIVGTIGLIGIVGGSLDNANLTENCVKLINLQDIDNHFIYYWLISPFGQDEISKGMDFNALFALGNKMSKEDILFLKSNQYVNQHEYRFIWSVLNNQTPEYIDLYVPDAIQFCKKVEI